MKKVLLLILAILVIIVSVILIGGPNMAKNYLQENSQELLGRKLQISELDFNAFNGHLLLTDLKVYEELDSTVFVKFDTLYTDLTLYKLFSGTFLTEAFHIKGLKINVKSENNQFNFDDLIPEVDSTSADTTIENEDSFIHTFTINDIQILYSEVIYDNLEMGAYHNLKDINIRVPGITIGDTKTKAGLDFSIAKGGKFHLEVDFNNENNNYDVTMGVENLDLSPYLIYAQSSMNISNLEGLFNGKINIVGNLDTPSTPVIKGSMNLNNFAISDNKEVEVFRLGSLFMDAKELNLNTNRYHFGALTLTHPTINAVQYAELDNLRTLMKEESDTSNIADVTVETNVESAPLTYLLEEFRLNAGELNYTDNTIANGPFSYTIHAIDFSADSLTEGRNVTFNMDAIMNGEGTFKGFVVTDPGDPSKGGTFDLEFKKIPINDFSVFSINSTAYPINSGRLSFQTKNKIVHNHINSHLIMKLYKTELDNKLKTVKPEYNVPMKLGIMVMQDPKGLIHIDVPAEGDIDDPEFRYSKLIWKAVMNVLVKAATSPYNLLADAIGASEDDIKFIRFELLQYELGPEQTAQLDLITDILLQKPGISVKSNQVLDYKKEQKLIKVYLAKKGMFLEEEYGNDTLDIQLDEVDIAKVLHMEESPKLIKFLEGKTQSEKGKLSFTELVELYVTEENILKTHQKLIQARTLNMKKYIAEKGLSDRLTFSDGSTDDTNRNKPRFEMHYEVKEN
ncbi:MAG: DUF748 domain-containing protein [Salibacteraceae bacterium]